jgi:myo-inositol-1(or 4)-monophosphatase
MTDLRKICFEVCELSKKVGEFIYGEQKNIRAETVEIKSVNSLVTYVDKTAEKKIVERLKELLPGCGFITEESTAGNKNEDYIWIVDPLDGTTNFIHGIPCYSVSIGLTYKGKLVLGVIYEINLKECFYSWEGGKAYLNENEIHVSKTSELKNSLLATGFPYYDYERTSEYMKLFQHLMKHSRGLRRLGSAAVDLAYVACGRFDSFYEYSLNPWDVAAGVFLVQQAGGKVCDFKGGDDYLFGKEIIACNNNSFEELKNTVTVFFK